MKSQMDKSEQIVDRYLRALGYTSVIFEPDGNIPPDFLVDGRIAVEVRRLNQNFPTNECKNEGLESLFIPLVQKIKELLPALGPSIQGESWYISIKFHRPVDPWRSLKPKIRKALLGFMHSPVREATTITISQRFKIDISKTGRPYPSFFLLGGCSDFDAGGFILAEIEKNLRLCIEEKERKIAPYRSKYPVWWLVLPDHIGYSLEAESRREFREQITMDHTWDKLVLVDPLDHKRAFEMEAKRPLESTEPQNQPNSFFSPLTSTFGYDPKLPENIREVFMWLSQDVAALREKWDFYLKLFAKENADLLSELASASFQIIEESLRDDMTMSIFRLSDQVNSGRGNDKIDYLSLNTLISRFDNPRETSELIKAFRKACAPIRQYRNMRVGHNNLKAKIQPKDNPLPGIGRKDIDLIIHLAEQILNCIYQQYVDSELGFESVDIGGADALVFWLQTAKEHDEAARQQMLKRMVSQGGS